jgi:hypothetical protein
MPECGSSLTENLNAFNVHNVPPRPIGTHTTTLGTWLQNRYPARRIHHGETETLPRILQGTQRLGATTVTAAGPSLHAPGSPWSGLRAQAIKQGWRLPARTSAMFPCWDNSTSNGPLLG